MDLYARSVTKRLCTLRNRLHVDEQHTLLHLSSRSSQALPVFIYEPIQMACTIQFPILYKRLHYG